MNILITGVPGTGKTEVSRALSERLGYRVVSDKEFSVKNNLGRYEGKEYVVSISKLNKCIKEKRRAKTIYEGHLWCELSKNNLSMFEYVFVLRAPKKLLSKRQKQRGYPVQKIFENIFCQDIKYIEKKLQDKCIAYKTINTGENLEDTLNKILVVIYGKGTGYSTATNRKGN